MAHETRTTQRKSAEGAAVTSRGAWTYIAVFLALPWLVIAAMALFLEFSFWVMFTMLLLFSLGVVFGPAFLGGQA